MNVGKQLKSRDTNPVIAISRTNYALVSGLSNATGTTCKAIVDKAIQRYIKELFTHSK